MLLWAIAPAREPATSLSPMPSVSWLLPIKRLIWQRRHHLLITDTYCDKHVASWTQICVCVHLLVGHELNSRLRSNFDDIDAIPSPQWPHTTLTYHLCKAATDAHAVALGGMNLRRPVPAQTDSFQRIHLSLFSLSKIKLHLLWKPVVVLPAWVLWACLVVLCRFETLHRLLLRLQGVSTTFLFSSPLQWIHQAPPDFLLHLRSVAEADSFIMVILQVHSQS